MRFFRELYYECKYLSEELILLAKHPTRKKTISEIKYHWFKIWRILIFHPWYCLIRGIKNLWNWFPLIWSNDVWDYYQLCEIMDKQLHDMEKFWEEEVRKERIPEYNHEKGFRCQYRRIYKRIKWSRKLMKMWRDEHYASKAYDEHKLAFPNDPNMFDHDEEDITRDEYGVPILYKCKSMSEDSSKDYRERTDKARKKDEKTLKLWTKQLQRIQNWWYIFIFAISFGYDQVLNYMS